MVNQLSQLTNRHESDTDDATPTKITILLQMFQRRWDKFVECVGKISFKQALKEGGEAVKKNKPIFEGRVRHSEHKRIHSGLEYLNVKQAKEKQMPIYT